MQLEKLFFTGLLIVSYSKLDAQVKPPLAFQEYSEGLNPVEEIRLFDLKEIKVRKIDSAYVIYHPASWAEYEPTINPCTCSYNDTLELYIFDSEGRIRRKTSFQNLGQFSTTFFFDSAGRRTAIDSYRKRGNKAGTSTFIIPYSDTAFNPRIVHSKKQGTDSIVTSIYFAKFRHGYDTSAVTRDRFTKNGILIETESAVNKKNEREFNDDTGESTYHYGYGYDDKGRLVYYRNYLSNEYEKISYPFYGKLTETYSSKTNLLQKQRLKLLDENNGIITVTFENRRIILTPLEKGSKLYKLRTVVDVGPVPLLEYYEIVYKRSNQKGND